MSTQIALAIAVLPCGPLHDSPVTALAQPPPNILRPWLSHGYRTFTFSGELRYQLLRLESPCERRNVLLIDITGFYIGPSPLTYAALNSDDSEESYLMLRPPYSLTGIAEGFLCNVIRRVAPEVV